jgi:membrane associated rhomboid family serine protease
LSPDVEYYLGFSGVLHGILAYALTSTINRPWHALGLLGVAIKLAYEQLSHFNPLYLQSSIGDAVVVDAHLYGALSGALLALLACWQRRHRRLTHHRANSAVTPTRRLAAAHHYPTDHGDGGYCERISGP